MEDSERWLELWISIADFFNQESDRAAAIMASTFVDEFLKTYIKAFLINDPFTTNLFDGYAPFSSLSARIDFAYTEGLITTNIKENLHLIQKIRNHFTCHSAESSFDDLSVRELCFELSTFQTCGNSKLQIKNNNSKAQYIFVIGLLIELIIYEWKRRERLYVE